jgi:hypothetical protein
MIDCVTTKSIRSATLNRLINYSVDDLAFAPRRPRVRSPSRETWERPRGLHPGSNSHKTRRNNTLFRNAPTDDPLDSSSLRHSWLQARKARSGHPTLQPLDSVLRPTIVPFVWRPHVKISQLADWCGTNYTSLLPLLNAGQAESCSCRANCRKAKGIRTGGSTNCKELQHIVDRITWVWRRLA